MTNSIGYIISYKILKFYDFSLFPIPDSRFPIPDSRFPTLTGKF
ncbi:hypothetical protein [Moorena bouillonii]|nr:hypothetical protein [Moorena bouillonii]